MEQCVLYIGYECIQEGMDGAICHYKSDVYLFTLLPLAI